MEITFEFNKWVLYLYITSSHHCYKSKASLKWFLLNIIDWFGLHLQITSHVLSHFEYQCRGMYFLLKLYAPIVLILLFLVMEPKTLLIHSLDENFDISYQVAVLTTWTFVFVVVSRRLRVACVWNDISYRT